MSAELQVVPYGNGWDVIYERARNAESHHPTREAAVVAATVQARRDGAMARSSSHSIAMATRSPGTTTAPLTRHG